MFEQNDICAVVNLQEKKVALFIDGKEVATIKQNMSKNFYFDGKEYIFRHSRSYCEVTSIEEESKWKMVKMYNI